MLETAIRPYLQRHLFTPLAKLLSTFLTPNQTTFLAILFGLTTPVCTLLSYPCVAVGCLVISGLLDVLDGSIARFHNASSPLGTVYDIVGDRIVEFAIILGLYGYAPHERGWETLAVLGSSYLCVATFLVVGMLTPNTSDKTFHYSPGLIERAEAFIFFSLMILLPSLFPLLAVIYTVSVLYTSFKRIYDFRQKTIKI